MKGIYFISTPTSKTFLAIKRFQKQRGWQLVLTPDDQAHGVERWSCRERNLIPSSSLKLTITPLFSQKKN
jgi:hypothetical protein